MNKNIFVRNKVSSIQKIQKIYSKIRLMTKFQIHKLTFYYDKRVIKNVFSLIIYSIDIFN